MEHIFSMDRGFKAKLCLWDAPLSINVTQSWRTNLPMTQAPITSPIMRKVMLTTTPLEWLVATHEIFDANTGGERSKIKWLFESNLS